MWRISPNAAPTIHTQHLRCGQKIKEEKGNISKGKRECPLRRLPFPQGTSPKHSTPLWDPTQ